LKVGKDDVFYDLGCGVGKTVLQVGVQTGCKRSIGIELSKTRFQLCEDAYSLMLRDIQRTDDEKKSIGFNPKRTAIIFKHQNILDTNLADATTVFWNNVCFPQTQCHDIIEQFHKQLKSGTRIVCMKQICARHGPMCKKSPCHSFELVGEAMVRCTWTWRTTAYVYVKK
jgi:hypothetical protein